MRLIDADELKKAFEAWKTMDDYYHDTDCDDIPLSEAFDLIDNAPTITTEEQVDLNEVKAIAEEAEQERPKYFPPCEDCNKKMEEIRQAYDKMKAMERPQGKWIVSHTYDCHSDIINIYTCPFCGKKEYAAYPFCHCGAELKGGAENEKNDK